ncbi:MAG: TonB family protein [Candidatus Gastranaerophilales bacterium]|nr:TonB family protein [Candidatus Gastranaerophilales bacterium]
MALLGNKYDFIDDEPLESDDYRIPSVFQNQEETKGLTLKKSIVLSTILHPAVVGFAWLLIFILTLLGIKITVFDKPQPQPKDIEFVLVNKEATPINKNTKFRADKNSRAGGKHDPTRKVSMPQAPAPKAKSTRSQNAAPAQSAKKAPTKKQPTKATTNTKTHSTQKHVKSAAPASKAFEFFAPRPTAKPSAPRPVAKPKSNFTIPVPKSAIPGVATPSGGPLTSAPHATGRGGNGSGSGHPSPSFAPTKSGTGSGTGAGSGGRFSGSRGGTGSGGNLGNPGPGNPKGAPGIDAVREPDFGPYMRELQRRIKMNWEPPKGNESKRVVLLFTITRDGRLQSVHVSKSSGLAAADKAAISAVQLTAPFRPLPPEYKGSNVDIQFTFDYNVFGASMR